MTEAKETEAPVEDGWAKVEMHEFPEAIISWDDTKETEGRLLWRESVQTTGLNGDERESTIYAFAGPDGVEFGVWGTANLDPQLAKIADGQLVRIVQDAPKKLSGGRSMRKFDVYSRSE